VIEINSQGQIVKEIIKSWLPTEEERKVKKKERSSL
jgi:hypothetical protein